MDTKRSIILDGEIYWAARDVVAEIYKSNSTCAIGRLKRLCKCKINGWFASKLLSREYKFYGSGQHLSIINAAEIERLKKYLSHKIIHKPPRIEKGTKRSIQLMDGVFYWAASDMVTEIFGRDSPAKPSNRLYILSQHKIEGPRVSKLLSRKHKFPREPREIPIINAAEIEELRKIVINTQKIEKKGFVYAGYSEGNGTKIGMTTRDDPVKRLKDSNTWVLEPYELLDCIQCEKPTTLEKYIHINLDEYKVGEHNREVFDLPHDLTMTLFHYIKKALKNGQDVSRDMVSAAMVRTLEERQSLNFLGLAYPIQ